MAQKWPRSDDFNWGTGGLGLVYVPVSYWSPSSRRIHSGYARLRTSSLDGTATPYSTGGSSYDLDSTYAELHDGYSFSSPIQTGTNSKRKRVAAFANETQDGFAALGSCNWEAHSTVWGKEVVLDGTVRGVFSVLSLSGGLNPQSFKTFGLIHRNISALLNTGGAWSSGTDGMFSPDAYAFIVTADTTCTYLNYFLIRWKLSVPTTAVLAVGIKQTINKWSSGNDSTFSPIGLQRPFRLSMTVINNGSAQPVITCKIARWDPATSAFSGDQTVLSYTDTDVTFKLYTQGFCGFIMGGPDTTGNNPPAGYVASRSVHACHAFEIFDGSDVLLFRDEWQRAVPGLSYQNFPTSPSRWKDLNGVSGRSLNALWIGDNSLYGGTYTSGGLLESWRELQADASTSAWVQNTAYAQVYGMAYNKPSESPYGSDRTTGVVVTSTGTWPSGGWFGIFGRGNPSVAGNNLPLYHAHKSYCLRLKEIAGSYRFEIVHYDDALTPTVLAATVSQSLAAWGITVGTSATLKPRLELENIGQTPATGDVRIRGWQDATQLDFTPATSGVSVPAGIIFDGLDIFDTRANRTLSGVVEGILPNAAAFPSGKKFVFDYWTDNWVAPDPGDPGDPDNPAIAEEDMATIALNSECVGKTGTLTVPYDWGVQEQAKAEAIIAPFEAGYRVRSVRHTRQRRRWTIRANAITDSERTTLLNFWTSHKGAEIPFDWAEPETGATVAVRFADDSLGVTLANPAVRQFEFVLEEVFC